MKHNKRLERFTKEEISDAHILSENLTIDERNEILKEFREERKRMLSNLTNEQRIFSSILQLRFQIEDYLKKESYDFEMSFCFFLKEYIARLQLKNKDFADQIGIETVELSQILNAHRKPNDRILIRLEIHSNKNISAVLWHRMLEKDKEYELINNNKLRQDEKKFVRPIFFDSF